MKIAIITVAGISSRFNDGIAENDKKLKAVFYEDKPQNTLIYHLLRKCDFADKIIVVGGYKIDSLKEYVDSLEDEVKTRIEIVYNEHYKDLGSGYSLYLGLKEAFVHNLDEVLFVEGDLDIDDESFAKIVDSKESVLTYTHEPIYANKAVVLYKDADDRYRYAFNSDHGLLTISSPFSCILNSGQTWKFTDMDKLKKATDDFFENSKADTNLRIIQNYLDMGVEAELVALNRWTNCNTREDYKKILSYWEEI
ncbi:MAG: hypothetical protein K6F17_05260 [Lachnospiraceae bacterium]|nr:hypothetical protein [Lachnospiraceae bacterium]